jgi:SAM-dependent methyltransferase
VSVVVIFLDAERFLREAIESVFAQTHEPWELLLVDDGSTDRSTAIAREYAGRHPGRVRYLEHEGHRNRGKGASRNLGIEHAKGEYVGFVDADDVLLPRALEEQVALLERHPRAGMVYGLAEWWYSWAGAPGDRARDFVPDLGLPAEGLYEPPSLVAPMFLRQEAAVPCTCSFLVRRDVLDQVGGFEEGFTGVANVYEDQAFYAKVLAGVPVLASAACWSRYRQHPGASCAAMERRGEGHPARLRFLAWLQRYVRWQGIQDPPLRRGLRRQVWRCRVAATAARVARTPAGAVLRRARRPAARLSRRVLPSPLHHRLGAAVRGEPYRPPVGWVRLGHLRRVTPLGRDFGASRGRPVDRHYIERFLAGHADDVRGRVLEVADDAYTRRFGGRRVTRSDVLHVTGDGPRTTLVGDLARGDGLPGDAFDCVILTQTLHLIYDVPAALGTVHRILRPGGVLLATVPGITQVSRYDADRWGQFWSVTPLALRRLLASAFPAGAVEVGAHGNVLAATAFLYGLAAEELRPAELDAFDPDYPLVVTGRAVKAGPGTRPPGAP